MKRLKLKEKPKRLSLSSPSSKEPGDINSLLEAHHSNTKENKNTPYFKWIPFKKQLPLDNNDTILVYGKKFSQLFDTQSYIALQHYLHSRYCDYDNKPTYWMRIKLPEE